MGVGGLSITNKELADSSLRAKNVRSTFFTTIGTASSGNIGGALATGESFILDGGGFFETEIALVSGLDSGFPNYEPIYDASGVMVTVSALNTAGDYTLSAAPVGAASFGFIYAYTVSLFLWNPDRSLTESQLEQNLQSVYDNSVVPILTLTSPPGTLDIRDNSTPLGTPLLAVQNNDGSTTFFKVSADETTITVILTLGSTKFVQEQAHFPALSGGRVPLDADVAYIVSKKFTLTADGFDWPAGGNCAIFGTASTVTTITLTGSGPLFRSTDTGVVFVSNVNIFGTGTQTILDIADSSPAAGDAFAFDNLTLACFAAVGAISSVPTSAILQTQFINCGTGLTFTDTTALLILDRVNYANAVTSNTPHFSFVGTFSRISTNIVTGAPQTGESLFDFDSGMTVDSASILDTTFSDANGGAFFEPGSLTQEDIRFDYDGGSGAPESQIIGEMTSFSNALETVISTTDTYVPINFVTGGVVTLQAFRANPGATGSITAFADAGGGLTTVTSAGHTLANGDTASISGTTSYNGVFVVSSATTNTYDIVTPFAADDATGTWYRPPNIEYEGKSNNNVVRTEGMVVINNSTDPDIEGDLIATAVLMDKGTGYVIVPSTAWELNMGNVLGSPQQLFDSSGFTGLETGTLFALFGKNGTGTNNFTASTIKFIASKS